jgi:PQQ enzyme-like repeat protein
MNHSRLGSLAIGLVVGACGGSSAAPDSGAAIDAPVVPPGVSVVTHHNSATRDGVYVAPTLTRAAAATITQDLGFQATIAGPTYAHPLFFDAGEGGQDLVLVATERNDVYALDATTGAEIWHNHLGAPVPLADLPCGNIDPLGITGTPYLDVPRRSIYLDAMILDSGNPKHFIFALSLDDGTVKTGWPVDVDATVSYEGMGFDSSVQNQRGALLVLGDRLYVPYGGHYGDCGNYYGWLVGVPVADPGAPQAWATRAQGAGSWAPGGVASDGTNLFIATGNGFGTSTWRDQEAIIRLTPGPEFSENAADYWAPTNWLDLDGGDVDLGGSGPVLFHVAGATPADLAIALGKDGNAYLIDRANMGGVSDALDALAVSPSEIVQAAAAYPAAQGVNVAFRGPGLGCPGGQSGDLTALHITATSPPQLEVAWCASENGQGSPMVTTTDGQAESIVWTIGSESSQQLRAFDGDTGAVIFDGAGTDVDTFKRFVSPIVGKGRIFVAGASGVYAFATN